MTTTLAEAPATDPKPSPFHTALDAAMKSEAPAEQEQPKSEKAPEAPREEQEKPKETEKPKAPDALFKKADAPKSALDEIAEPPKLDAKGKAGWEKLKSEARTFQAKAEALERSIAEAKAAGRDPDALESRLKEHEAKLKEYDAIVSRARLEDHPDFRREFIDGRTKVMEKAKTIIEESGGDSKAIETALNLKGKARVEALREIASDLDGFQSGRLGRVIDELTDLDERADARRADSAKAYDELRATERQREADSRAAAIKGKILEFEDVSRELRSAHPVLNHAEGHDAWNAQADAILRESRAAVEANPATNIRAEIESRTAAVYHRLFTEANDLVTAHESKIAELEAELKAIHSKSPGLAGRGQQAQPGEKRSFSTQLAEAFGV